MAAHAHMIAGLTGAGKTTYARALARDLGAVRMSIDEWNGNLFFMDRSPESDFGWFYERVQRCTRQMRETASQVLDAGVPVVFDCGFTNRLERGIFYDWADSSGFDLTLHFIATDPETCWQRVERRNLEKGETFALTVTKEMFDFMQRLWEPPDEAEIRERNGVVVD